jgi:Kdo2-lipid IVA lauroyltransferase/acyltransferase
LAARSPVRNGIETILVRGMLASLQLGPRQVAETLARSYAQDLDVFIPRWRRIALRNLTLAMPHLDQPARLRVIDGMLDSIGRLLAAVARFPSIHKANIGEWIRYDGFEHYAAAKAKGRGVLFATAHLGNWELSAFAHALMTEPMNIVVRPLDNPLLDRIAEERRSLSGNRVLGKKDFLRPVLRALQNNEAVGMLVDQNSTLASGIFVNFFGVPACVDAGFARLAAHTGAAVIPGFAVWSEAERRYVLRFYAPVDIVGDIHADTQAVHAALERAVREYPEQWLWIHRRWKTRPPGEPSLY